MIIFTRFRYSIISREPPNPSQKNTQPTTHKSPTPITLAENPFASLRAPASGSRLRAKSLPRNFSSRCKVSSFEHHTNALRFRTNPSPISRRHRSADPTYRRSKSHDRGRKAALASGPRAHVSTRFREHAQSKQRKKMKRGGMGVWHRGHNHGGLPFILFTD